MKKFKKIIFLACFVMLIAVMAIAISAAAPESIDLDTANLVDKDNNAITIESVVDKDGNTISPKEEGGTVYALPLYDADGNALSYYLNSTTLTAALSSTYFTASSSKIGTAPDFVIINWQHDYFNSTTTTPDLQNKTKLKYVWLNENTKTIYGYGFKQTGLAEITIPSSVTEIKTQAFLNCYCLKTVNLAENGNLTTIGEGAFNGCKVLETIDLTKPAALTTIGANAFKGNTALTGKIVIPSTVTTIGSNAFQNCTAITEINIPSSVTSMGGSAFYGCTALYTVDIAENGNIKSIGDSTFYNCKSLTIIDLSKFIALQTIESNAFRGAFNTGGTTTEQIKEIVIPATVTTIGDSAFNGCKRVLKVILSRDLTSIGNTAFSEADALVEMDFSQCTKDITIGNTLFNKSLKTLNLGPTKVTLDTETGSFKSGSLATVIMSYETFANLGAYAFNSGSNTTFYIVGGPDGITGSTTQKAIIDLRDAATTAGNNAKITAVTDDNVVEYEYGNTSYTGSCIVFNYNLCVAFYGGEHTKSDAPILAYANGFDNAGTSTYTCKHSCGYVYDSTTIDPIFAASGYSTKKTADAIYGGFTVDPAALAKYNAYVGEGKELKYGIVIVNVGDASNISFTSGVINSANAIQVEIKDTTFTRFGFTLTGFTTTDLKELNLVISAYVIDGDNNMSFVQSGTSTDTAYYVASVDAIVGETTKGKLGVMTFTKITTLA